MINLLPDSEKKSLYYVKTFDALIAIAAYCVVFSLIITITSLALFYYLYNVEKLLSHQLESYLSNKEIQYVKDLEKQFEDFNSDLVLFKNEIIKKGVISPILKQLIKEIPEEIKLKSLIYSTDKNNQKIILSGSAATRESFLSFIETLRQDKNYKDIISPLQNIVKSVNIDFSITILL